MSRDCPQGGGEFQLSFQDFFHKRFSAGFEVHLELLLSVLTSGQFVLIK